MVDVCRRARHTEACRARLTPHIAARSPRAVWSKRLLAPPPLVVEAAPAQPACDPARRTAEDIENMVDVQSVGGPVADAPAAPQERLPAPVAALPTTRTSAGDDTETIVMLHALIQSKFATLEKFVEEYHLHGSAMPFVAALEKFVEAQAWRQPGPATMDVAAQVCGVDDLTEATVKEVREGIERAKNFPPQSSSQSPCRE